ncbi:uncharacterized protein BCR38DRAFT_429400 [Pseudomassariella vexata]|uniref:NADH:flavin oxidoreductase/NADH oxidase N-terminal domain-containing protein n=1 Tax=Pseudomassariella vexata TaxID=1141098 RepID=A0A1Y2E3M0_9PEZI|nr:uncharacterized protein BCR38DRAFT_429400 [Pseudomassariella vexata]ORY66150.1 hypothetical protein BCR38DRAFT_429400 [Pseudomassariella vexata]
MSTRYSSQEVDPAPLGQPLPFAFSGLTAKNRFLNGAMTERMASWSAKDPSKRGIPSEEYINLYRNWGKAGWGVILTGNIQVHAEHLEAPGNAIIGIDHPFSGERFETYKRVAKEAKADGSLLIAQISHPGRQISQELQPNPVSASDMQLTKQVWGMKFGKPHAASAQEIADIKAAFVHCAVYLEKAGFDGVQLHGAHGYLLAQFLSPTTNLRTDNYGGSLENRARIITEIANEIQAQTGKGFSLSIKINSVEFQEKGFSTDEATKLVQLLEAHKFDFVELSGGTYEQTAWHHERESTRAREGFFLEFAEKITPHLKQTKSYVTGGLRSAKAMVDALRTVDGVGLGRPACMEPRLPLDILSGKVKSCIKPITDESDFGLSVMLAGAQMRQIGRNQEPLDSSDQKHIDGFWKDLTAFTEAMKNDTKGEMSGHIDIQSIPVIPYGAAI